MLLLRSLVFVLGAWLPLYTLLSATRTFVLPRSSLDLLVRTVFRTMFGIFKLRMWRYTEYADRDRIMAIFAPFTLLMLLVTWLASVLTGYMLMFWALGVESLRTAFMLSGSSLLTLGFAAANDLPTTMLAFSEAMLGLILTAVLIGYLPTMYTTFSRRERAVALLEVRAGSPPSAVEMLLRFSRIQGLDRLREQWTTWEEWFVDLDESHTSLAPLVFFRSPLPSRSWVTAAGAVLDAAALTASTLDAPRDPQAELCIRAGSIALRRISDFFGITYDPNPREDDPRHAERISITKAEFDAAYDELAANGLALKPDREQAWRDFAGWRINYDAVLIGLARLTMAPEAPWSSDRLLGTKQAPVLPSLHLGKRRARSMRET